MQTIFRVQSPYKTPEGKMKTECYVFDFAPDRTLKIVAETAKFSSMAKTKEKKQQEYEEEKTQEMRDKETVRDFIELCPVISMDGGKMSQMDVNSIYSSWRMFLSTVWYVRDLMTYVSTTRRNSIRLIRRFSIKLVRMEVRLLTRNAKKPKKSLTSAT